ncbi:MAG: ABC transporter permease [Bacillota bacterium]
MKSYIFKRLLSLIPVIIIVAIITFFITNLMPGDPARVILGNMATEEQVVQLEETLGLDQPLIYRFFDWAGDIIRGDLGDSLYLNSSVRAAILNRIEPTFLIALMAQIMGGVLGIFLGILAAVNHKKVLDKLSITISLLGISVPSFWLSIIFILIFSVWLRLFPVSGYEPLAEAGLSTFKYLILPSTALAFMQAGIIARITRSSLLDTFKEDYIRTARSKGLYQRNIIIKHSLRNAMVPIITVIGHNFAILLGGTWIIETIFFIPGTGYLAINAIMRRDIPVIQGCIIFVALIYIFINFFVDLSYAFFDPRIKYS